MCKIAIIPHIKPGLERKALKLAQAMTPGMTKIDRDGFGYMALGDSGIFGERWLDVKQAWRKKPKGDPALESALELYGDSLEIPESYNSFGNPTARIHCLALHGRLSTNSVSIQNTHPFVSDCETHGIIHNGVISNYHEFRSDMRSTCDSEAILIQVKKTALADSVESIQAVASQLQGYFAVASIARNSSGQWVLDIFRDSSAQLSAVFVRELGCFVFCTDEKIVRDACRKIGFHALQAFKVKPCTLMRHDPMTGEMTHKRHFIERPSDPAPVNFNESRFNDPRYLSDPPGYRADDDAPLDPLADVYGEDTLDTYDYFTKLNRK